MHPGPTRRPRRVLTAAVLVVALALVFAPAAGAATGAHTVTYDRYSLKIDGKRTYIWSGEFHYWRLPSPSLARVLPVGATVRPAPPRSVPRLT
jgi:hypothetical protein